MLPINKSIRFGLSTVIFPCLSSPEDDAQHQPERKQQGRNQKVGKPISLGQALLQPLAFLVQFFPRHIEIPLCLVPRFRFPDLDGPGLFGRQPQARALSSRFGWRRR